MPDSQNFENIVYDNYDDDDNEDQLHVEDEEDEIPFNHNEFNKAEPTQQEPRRNVADELNALHAAIATLTKTVTDNQKRTHGKASGSEHQLKRNKKQIDKDILQRIEQRMATLEHTQSHNNAMLDHGQAQPHQNVQNRTSRNGSRNDVSPPAANRQHQVNNNCAFCNGDHWASECPQYPTLPERPQQCRYRNRCKRCLREANHLVTSCNVDLQCYFCRRNRRTHLMHRHNSAFCPYQFPM